MVSQFGNNEIGNWAINMKLRASHGLKLIKRHGGQFFAQHETPLGDVDHRMTGIDASDTCDASQWKSTFFDEFRLTLFVICSVITTTCFAPCTRSIAPPTAGTPLAPTRQLARSPFWAT